MIELSELLDASRVRCQCDIRSKKRAFQTLAELLAPSISDLESDGKKAQGDDAEPADPDMDIFDALFSRERLGCTGLGHGIALPHSRLSNLDEPMAAMITLSDGIDFDAPDGEPVDVLVGLLVPEHCNDEHLKILAALAKRFSNDYFREEIRAFGTDQSAELFQFLQQPTPAA